MSYRTLQPLGTGATATTYLAEDLQRSARPVAQKIFNSEWSQHYRHRIDGEFGLLARLSHPYLVRVQDYGVTDDRCFLITDFVTGKPLLDHLRGRSENTIYWYFAQLLEALDYLAFRNVVHLDLKPENILIETAPPGGRDPHLKVLDFGLAAMVLHPEGPGGAIGSPPFTAPEFARDRKWDLRSDLYSFGILLYRTLSGRNPFPGTGPLEILACQWNQDPEPLNHYVPKLATKMVEFVHRLISADPEKRPSSPRQALDEFRQILGGSLGTSPSWKISIFDDPDLNFRETELKSILEKLLHTQEIVAVRGPGGSGKTFACRWLQRQLWRAKRNVLFLDGTELFLNDPAMVSPNDWVIIDNAHLGPFSSWLQHVASSHICLTLTETENVLEPITENITHLSPLKRPVVEHILRKIFQQSSTQALSPFVPGEDLWPGALVAQAQHWVRHQVIQWTPSGWTHAPVPDSEKDPIATTSSPIRETLLKLLQESRISLDLSTLASWMECSLDEAESLLEQLTQDRLVMRRWQAGTVLYRGISHPHTESTTLKTKTRDLLLRQLLEAGRYSEGLEIIDQSCTQPLRPETTLLRAEFLAGAQQLRAAKNLLTPRLLKTLSKTDQCKAEELLGKIALFNGEHPEAKTRLQRAKKNYAALADPDGQARALLHLGILAQRTGHIPEAQKYFEQVIALADGADLSKLIAGVGKLNLGNLYYDRGEYSEAKPLYEAAVDLLEASGHGPVTAQAYLNTAHLYYYLGDAFAAEEYCRKAIRLAIEHRFPLTQGYALLLLALLDQNRDNLERQGLRLDEAIEIFARAELHYEWIQAKINQAYYFDAKQNRQQAERVSREALTKAQSLNSPDLIAKAQLVLGKVLRQNSEKLPEAAENLKSAMQYFSKAKNEEVLWQVEFELGEVERRQGNREAAEFLFSQSESTLGSLLAKLPPGLQESYLRDKKFQLVGAAKNRLLKEKK